MCERELGASRDERQREQGEREREQGGREQGVRERLGWVGLGEAYHAHLRISTRFYASSVLLIYEGAEYIRVDDERDNKVRVLIRPCKRAL